MNNVYFVLAQIHPKTKKATCQTLCFDIDYSGSNRPFYSKQIAVDQNQKRIFTLNHLKLFNVLKTTPLAEVLTVSFSHHLDHSCAHIY